MNAKKPAFFGSHKQLEVQPSSLYKVTKMSEFIRVRRSQQNMSLGVPHPFKKVLERVEFVTVEQIGDSLLFSPLVVAEPQTAPLSCEDVGAAEARNLSRRDRNE